MEGRENLTVDGRDTEGRDTDGRDTDCLETDGLDVDCPLLGRTDFLETLRLGSILIL